MRLWSLHPCYLDAKGLTALWREGLLAQQVLLGRTKGYKHHPQLLRFLQSGLPVASVSSYLSRVADEADRRRYRFDRSKISESSKADKLPVTSGQLRYEFSHLLNKLKARNPKWCDRIGRVKRIKPHPLFYQIDGDVEGWEVLPVKPV